ncbi:urea transporter 1-like isoform X2 [Neocloeon triangulifer]|uniref:urea transporter 1-like isoform X2 n=1 Tax=Neocloeon triangulifer TaxID=2078957 RepID=UPI00286F41D6|nr:urea transporter 1-like isoform X2 [Neocloeon triangulifer]
MGSTEEKKDEATVPLSGEEPTKKETSGTTKGVVGVLGSFKWLSLCGDAPLITDKLDHAIDESKTRVKRAFYYLMHFLDVTGRNFGQVCFANNPISGFLILAGLAVGDPLVALCGFVASTVGIFFSLLMQQPRGSIRAGLCCYNAALFGAVLPALALGPNPWAEPLTVWICVVLGSIFTVVITVSVANSLSSLKPAIPLFTLPFNLVALFAVVVLRVHHQAQQPTRVPNPDFDWMHLVEGSFLGAGQVFAVQDLYCSGLVLFGMLICSPVLALAGFFGSLVGTFLGAAVSANLWNAAYNGILGYNAFLASCAVCFFYVPTWRSFLVAFLNAALTVIVQVALGWAFADTALPVLTLPFVGASLIVLGMTAEKEALPRSMAPLTFPEQHRAKWLQDARRESVQSTDTNTHP